MRYPGMRYLYHITWSDGTTEERTGTSQFRVVQQSYWERFGQYGHLSEAVITSAEPEPIEETNE